MRFEEALKLMRDKKKVRMKFWEEGEYIESNGYVIRTEEHKRYDIPSSDILSTEWEEYKAQKSTTPKKAGHNTRFKKERVLDKK